MNARSFERNAGLRLWSGVAAILAVCGTGAVNGHEHTAPWLDESSLDRGLYVEVRHPRVIRNPRSFDISVHLSNLLGNEAVTVREVRYSLPGAFDNVVHQRRHPLPSKRGAYRRYKASLEQMESAGRRRDRASVERLRAESQSQLLDITASAFRDRERVEGSFVPPVGRVMNLTVEVDVAEAEGLRTIRRDITIPIQPPLPGGTDGSWYAGDQHLHTAYSIDAFFLQGTVESVTRYADTAQVIGLDWIIVTDHTNVGFLVWYKPYLYDLGERMARIYRDRNDYLVLQGEEMGIGSPGIFGEAAHLLVYPHTVDSTGYLVNPCPGTLFGHTNCEPEQVILDRVNESGGIGFIAHPFDSVPFFFVPWDQGSDAVGWAGIEIFNSDTGSLGEQDMQAVGWWHELLDEIQPPRNGELAIRPDYPTRFPVGIGNSDAHQPARIGSMFSYARLPGHVRGTSMVPRQDLMNAFVEGRVVASNGPLAYAEIGGAGTGGVAIVPPGPSPLTLTLQTTPEFGPVSDYVMKIFVNGALRREVPPGATGFERTVVVDEAFSTADKFVTLVAQRVRCDDCSPSELRFISLANPIWLELSTVNPPMTPLADPEAR
jgi:hypothetical protein